MSACGLSARPLRLDADDGLAAVAGQGSVARLEERFARRVGVPHAVAVCSGTAALHAALLAAGVGPGDEVICPALDWTAAATVTLHLGAVPRFADVDPHTYTIDPRCAGRMVSARTRALVATHLFGHPCDLAALSDLAADTDRLLIEDAAQALGATCQGGPVGSWGDLACFSFGPRKLLSAGEGGMVVTPHEDLWERIIGLCQHPLRQQWEGVPVQPFVLNYRMHPAAAEWALDGWKVMALRLELRRRQLAWTNRQLADSPCLEPVVVAPGCRHAAFRLCARLREGVRREEARAWLAQPGLDAVAPPALYLPAELKRSLAAGHWSRHPCRERLAAAAQARCPVARELYRRRLLCVA